jgi:hypothetical protein
LEIPDVRDAAKAMDDEVMAEQSLFAAAAAVAVAAVVAPEHSPCAVAGLAAVNAVDAEAGRPVVTTLVLRRQLRSSPFAAAAAAVVAGAEAVDQAGLAAGDSVVQPYMAVDSLVAWPDGLVVAFAQTGADAGIVDL